MQVLPRNVRFTSETWATPVEVYVTTVAASDNLVYHFRVRHDIKSSDYMYSRVADVTVSMIVVPSPPGTASGPAVRAFEPGCDSEALSLAALRPVVASSSSTGRLPRYAVDGNTSTSWMSAGVAESETFLTVDLGRSYAVASTVAFFSDDFACPFNLSTANANATSSEQGAPTLSRAHSLFALIGAEMLPDSPPTDSQYVGNSITDRLSLDGAQTIHFVDTSSVFLTAGKITAWEYYGGRAGDHRFQVWRPHSTTEFKLMCENALAAATTHTVIRHEVLTVDQCEVAAGDVIGWYHQGQGVIDWNEDGGNTVRWQLGDRAEVGSTLAFGASGSRTYSIRAEVTQVPSGRICADANLSNVGSVVECATAVQAFGMMLGGAPSWQSRSNWVDATTEAYHSERFIGTSIAAVVDAQLSTHTVFAGQAGFITFDMGLQTRIHAMWVRNDGDIAGVRSVVLASADTPIGPWSPLATLEATLSSEWQETSALDSFARFVRFAWSSNHGFVGETRIVDVQFLVSTGGVAVIEDSARPTGCLVDETGIGVWNKPVSCADAVAAPAPVGNACSGGVVLSNAGNVTHLNPATRASQGHNEDCTWTMMCSGASLVPTITFKSMDVESNFDYVHIFDGDTAGLAVSVHTGTSLPDPFTASGRVVSLRYTSDHSVSRAGFEATFSCCPVGVTAAEGARQVKCTSQHALGVPTSVGDSCVCSVGSASTVGVAAPAVVAHSLPHDLARYVTVHFDTTHCLVDNRQIDVRELQVLGRLPATTLKHNDHQFEDSCFRPPVAITEGHVGHSYQVVLDAQPSAIVTVVAAADEGLVVEPDTLRFSPVSWDTPQNFSVHAILDNTVVL